MSGTPNAAGNNSDTDTSADDTGDAGEGREVVDLSMEAIEKRMAELGHRAAADDADDGGAGVETKGDDIDDAVVVDDKEKPKAGAKDGAVEKEPTEDEKKSWQAKMKGEVEARETKIKALESDKQVFTARETEWVTAANETLLELQAVAAERDFLAGMLKKHNVELDPRDAELLQSRVEIAKMKRAGGLQQSLADQARQQQVLAAAGEVKQQVAVEARALIEKYKEMQDPAIAEDLLTMWSAAVTSAEQRKKEPPSMTAFVKKQIAALRLEKAQTQQQNQAGGTRNQRKAPRTLRANGTSAVPTSFPPTDEGIEAWAKSRGYES